MFKIYSSSAGSGKTYTLTKEYLKLALRPDEYDDYFRHILAVTFTNAAANEMKDRILKTLSRIKGEEEITDPKTVALLDELVCEIYHIQPDSDSFASYKAELRQKASSVFKTILHRYADFSVTTIDSFTQRVVAAFTDELGLPYSFEVELETDEVLELAIDNLIEKAGTDEMDEITTILSEYYTHAAAEGKSWNQLPELLREFGRNLTSDQFYQAVNAAQELSPSALRMIRTQLLAHNQQVEADIVAQGQRAWKRITEAGLDESDFTYGNAGVGGYLRAIAEGNTGKEPGTRVNNAVEKGEWYGKKTPMPVQGMIDAMTDELSDCIRQIQAIRDEQGQQVALFDCLLPHLQKLALLKQMRIEFDDLLRKDGRVHISEFNKKILTIVSSEPVPFLYERLGTRYNHILIDEFQDTSRLQFANLLPLIENSLAGDHLNMVVGDGKQAIYRFRGGDMDQIVALHSDKLDSLKSAHNPESWTADRIEGLKRHLDPNALTVNRRSAVPIVRFNNDFFDFTAQEFRGQHPKLTDIFDENKLFHQETPKEANQNGHVQIDFVAHDEEADKDLTARMLETTLLHLEKALADGYRYGDVAILCRKKAHARILANELNNRQIPLVSADSLSLEFSQPVKWLITLMRLLQRPEQRLLRYELLYLFHRVVRGIFPDDELTETLRRTAETADIAAMYNYLTAEGYPVDPYELSQLNPYELAERLTAQFGLFRQAEHNPFLFRFLDEVLAFNHKRSGHLSDFLLYWEGVQEKVSVEGSARNAVTIETIHKAKGREFPVVIIPFANWRVEPINDSTIWLDLTDIQTDALSHVAGTGQSTRLMSAPSNTTSKLRNTAVAAQYEEEMTRTFIENMNLLYVAFTRPTDRLYIVSKSSDFGKGNNQRDVSYWLHAFLRGSEAAQLCGCAWEEGRSSYEISLCADVKARKESDATLDEIILDEIVSGNRGQDLQLRRLADRMFDVTTFEQTRERDRKLCAALSLIKGPETIDTSLRRLLSEGLIRQAERAELRQHLLNIVSHPALSPLFDATLRIDTDRNILSSSRIHGAPHRVVHFPDGQIVLVQYESATDSVEESLDNLAASLRYFTNLYREMGFPEVEGRLVFLGDEPKVVRVV
ncbi:UvrD-helicase domain-containing protein [Spirosoma sp. BT702]|uniref:DNA 3'-5' helicase n=1 Tax=Spirosoma profusum TaxID=2771354 RepID=A0A926XWX8_9BACT|nr:UvrD-helicase domain-containing protein [Spirosoma profusum]MBD2701521.1 UvrD-helicase domain-containing protein [Spirosoma profusum]